MSQFDTLAQAIAQVGQVWPGKTNVFQDMDGVETEYTFPQIERDTATRAAALQALGLKKGDRIGLIIIEPEDFVLTFYAAIRIGVVPVPMYPPLSFGSLDAYADRTARVLTACGAKALIASTRLKNILFSQVDKVPSIERFVAAEELSHATGEPDYPEITEDDICFLQYTSGSTSDPKGVIVTHKSLIANCRGIITEGLELSPENNDRGISWLPLYHDMGLIGFVIAPYIHGIPTVYIPTVRFIRRPSAWLDAIHRHRGTVTFAPNFAYALAMKRVKKSQMEEWDLSCLKICGCGAEPIQGETMRAFTKLFNENCDLPLTSVLPAYGMAEATLAMSFKPIDDEFKTNFVDAETFENDKSVALPEQGKTFIEHVSCGRPFPGHRVVAMDTNANILAEGQEGELCFSGPSVAPGYWENPEATAKTFRDGWLHTGDLGYIHEGEVYVTGRLKDLIILNGRNLHPQSIEWEVAEIQGVRRGNVVAFSRPGGRSEELVVALETRAQDLDNLKAAVRARLQKEMGLTVAEIVALVPGTLPKTSSGKLQRAKARQQYLNNSLGKEGARTVGANAGRVTLARHVARSLWSRAKAAVRN
ncbi:MAG: acyl-CoA synthetase (AMP-forming)/AMP-acid ligase II [Myxococcota bacterium]|jgi:acyl-CoA synthetase (AMP-forming)/AMP-acid ligase II